MPPGVGVTVMMFVGQMITGGCVSLTLTVKLHIVVVPEVSVAAQVTVVVPFGNIEPDAGLQDTPTPGQLSFAETE
jgi:hypothetical protein